MRKSGLFVALFMMFACAVNAQDDSTTYADLYGKYEFSSGSPVSEVNIVWLDNQLSVTSPMGNAVMTKLGVDSFSMSYADGVIVFYRDSATRKVNRLVIYVSGMTLEAKKTDETKSVGWIMMPARKEEPNI